MRKTQQNLWLAGFAGVSTACIINFLITDVSSVDHESVPQPYALLAANTNQDQMVTFREVKKMLDSHFTRLDTDKDGMITLDEYAGRHINLFLAIDADSNRKLSPAEIRLHNMKRHNIKRDGEAQSLIYKTTYKD